MKRLLPLAAVSAGLVAAAPSLRAQPPRPAAPAEACYLLALGPGVGNGRPRVAIPAVIALRPGGRVVGAPSTADTLARRGGAMPAGGWRVLGADSLLVEWHPTWLGGTLELRLARAGRDLRGRYAVHGHQAGDGRGVARGDALAPHVACRSGRPAPGAVLAAAERRLAVWRAAQRPDAGRARAETRAAFEASLRETPVHALSLMNYRIAEFACRRGRPPASLAELRAARVADLRGPEAEWLGDRLWRDAWDRPIIYQRRGVGYEVRSAGPDGRAGTADDLAHVYDTIPLKRYPEGGCQ